MTASAVASVPRGQLPGRAGRATASPGPRGRRRATPPRAARRPGRRCPRRAATACAGGTYAVPGSTSRTSHRQVGQGDDVDAVAGPRADHQRQHARVGRHGLEPLETRASGRRSRCAGRARPAAPDHEDELPGATRRTHVSVANSRPGPTITSQTNHAAPVGSTAVFSSGGGMPRSLRGPGGRDHGCLTPSERLGWEGW